MPPAILYDSEDEDEDIVVPDDSETGARLSPDHPADIPGLDGTRDTHQSTGSTGKIDSLGNSTRD
jgi:hypothetical protein